MHTADALSRAPVKTESRQDKHIEAHVDGLISVLQVSDEKQEEIKAHTKSDQTMTCLKETILAGWPNERSQ